IRTPYREANNRHAFHQYTIILDSNKGAGLRDGLSSYLGENNIPSMIYYPVPGHRQKMFEAFGGLEYNLPVTDWLTDRVISLPMHPELGEEQLEHIAKTVLKYFS